METLCIYGCGGMGREIADLAYRMKKWKNIIFVDDNIKSRIVDELEVYTFDEAINHYNKANLEFIITIGEPLTRQMLYERLDRYNLNSANLISPEVYISRFSSVERGTIIHTGATLTVNVQIGRGCLINKHVVIGHDATIGNYTVISPNATIGGEANIGSGCFVGSGAVIRNGISIGENSIIGMGAVVLKDVDPNSVMVGNPAKLLRQNTNNKVFK